LNYTKIFYTALSVQIYIIRYLIALVCDYFRGSPVVSIALFLIEYFRCCCLRRILYCARYIIMSFMCRLKSI